MNPEQTNGAAARALANTVNAIILLSQETAFGMPPADWSFDSAPGNSAMLVKLLLALAAWYTDRWQGLGRVSIPALDCLQVPKFP
jgi:hypothetical protein